MAKAKKAKTKAGRRSGKTQAAAAKAAEPRFPSPATTGGREVALAALRHRRANQPKPIDNGSLYAGSPMYYYCKSCGHQADCLPESHWGRPRQLCSECEAMKGLGWLDQ